MPFRARLPPTIEEALCVVLMAPQLPSDHARNRNCLSKSTPGQEEDPEVKRSPPARGSLAASNSFNYSLIIPVAYARSKREQAPENYELEREDSPPIPESSEGSEVVDPDRRSGRLSGQRGNLSRSFQIRFPPPQDTHRPDQRGLDGRGAEQGSTCRRTRSC